MIKARIRRGTRHESPLSPWTHAIISASSAWLSGLSIRVCVAGMAGAEGGWQVAAGATMGYFVGFVVAAALVGYLAQRGETRHVVTSMSAMALGSFVIYAIGASWLAYRLDLPIASGEPNAISLGVTPFLLGDALKLLLAGAFLPAAWKMLDRTNGPRASVGWSASAATPTLVRTGSSAQIAPEAIDSDTGGS